MCPNIVLTRQVLATFKQKTELDNEIIDVWAHVMNVLFLKLLRENKRKLYFMTLSYVSTKHYMFYVFMLNVYMIDI